MNYSVFISFKNSEGGKKTYDSEVAEKLYAYLISKGIRVFFSNISLMEFGEAAYKDAIDDALDEVAIMVVIGSKAEYLTSQWCKYEWQSYQQNILAGIVKGTIVTYLGDIELAEVPTAIRHYQSFRLVDNSVEQMGDFVQRVLEKANPAPAPETEDVKAEQPAGQADPIFRKKEGSKYDPLRKGEVNRLTIQSRLVRDADAPALAALRERLKDRERIFILDVGCGHGIVTKDRFDSWENAFVLGIDNNETMLEKARNYTANPKRYAFERVEIDSPDFIEEMQDIMEKHGIDGFDLVFGAYILQHIKDPIKLLQRARTLLKPNGYVMFRNAADKSTIAYGDNGLVYKILEKTKLAPGVSNRDFGIELYHHLYTTGYKNIRVYGYLKEISGLDYDERMEIFRERFSWRDAYFRLAHEKDPADIEMKNNYEWMKFALEKLEEIFGDESFWYGETIMSVIASKK